jgi:hypothetical protein
MSRQYFLYVRVVVPFSLSLGTSMPRYQCRGPLDWTVKGCLLELNVTLMTGHDDVVHIYC